MISSDVGTACTSRRSTLPTAHCGPYPSAVPAAWIRNIPTGSAQQQAVAVDRAVVLHVRSDHARAATSAQPSSDAVPGQLKPVPQTGADWQKA